MRTISLFFLLGSTVLLAGCLVEGEDYGDPRPRPGDAPQSQLLDPVPVVAIIDGDTIDVEFNNTVERIRMQGIDTPELHPDPPGSPAEPFAIAARDFVQRNVGLEVDLTFDSRCPQPPETECRDSTPSERLLAYVGIVSGEDLGEMLLRNGLARVFNFGGQGLDKLTLYEAAEAEARNNNLGIWGP